MEWKKEKLDDKRGGWNRWSKQSESRVGRGSQNKEERQDIDGELLLV